MKMIVLLSSEDLDRNHCKEYAQQVTWHSLSGEAQLAVNAAGWATYLSEKGNTVVLAPHILQTLADRRANSEIEEALICLCRAVQ